MRRGSMRKPDMWKKQADPWNSESDMWKSYAQF